MRDFYRFIQQKQCWLAAFLFLAFLLRPGLSVGQQYTADFSTAPTFYAGTWPGWNTHVSVVLGGVEYAISIGSVSNWQYKTSGGNGNSAAIVAGAAGDVAGDVLVTLKRKDAKRFNFYGAWMKYANIASYPTRHLQVTYSGSTEPQATYGENSTVTLTKNVEVSSVDLMFRGVNMITLDNLIVGPAAVTVPTVTTGAAGSIGGTGATLGGDVTGDGNATVTERGIVWATTSNPTVGNSKVSAAGGTGSFSATLTGLTASTTYYARAYATNSAGTAYGNQVSFTTTDGNGPVTLHPTIDTSIDDFDSYPTDADCYAGYSMDFGPTDALLKFDLAGISGVVSSAKLRIYVNYTAQPNVPVNVWGSNDDSWEADIAAVPAKSSPVLVSSTIPGTGWKEFDVTNFIKSEAAGNKLATLILNGNSSAAASQEFYFNATEQGSNKPELVVTTAAALSANANLSALTLSQGTMSPAFAVASTSYTATVPYTTTSLNLTATLADTKATLKVNGSSAVSGNAVSVSLSVGANAIPVAVTAEDGTQKTYTVTVTRMNQPIALSQTQTNVSCNGGANGSASVTASGGTAPYTYSWSPSGGTAATATGLTAGTYTVTVTDANEQTATANFTITQPSALATTGIQTNVSCNGGSNGSASVTASGGTGPYTYSWSPSGSTSATATGLAAGTHTVTVTDANGCTAIRSYTITQPAALTASVTKSDATTMGGTDGTASVSVAGGVGSYTYSWSSSGGTAATATGLTAGNYTVTITDGNGCTLQKTVTIDQPNSVQVLALSRQGTSPSSAATVYFTLGFSQPVSGLSAANFQLSSLGLSGAGITGFSPVDANTYRIAVNTGTGNGELGLSLENDQNLSLPVGNLPFAATGNFVIDKQAPAAPVISSVSSDLGYDSADGITSDNTLSIAGTAEAGAIIEVSVAGTLSGTTTTDGSGNWSYAHPASLADGTYAITTQARDQAGNTSPVSTAFQVQVDLSRPVIVALSYPQNRTYVNNELLDFVFTYSEPVLVTGTPSLAITLGTGTVTAAYLSGSGTNTLTFRYQVADGVKDGDGIVLASNLSLTGGMRLQDKAGNDAQVNLPDPLVLSGVLVDGTQASITAVTVPANKICGPGEHLDITLAFSKAVTVSDGTPSLPITIGTTTVQAAFMGGSGSTTLTFRYTVQPGDADTDGISLGTAIQANGAIIKDATDINAKLLLNNVPATTGILVDAVALPLASVSIVSTNLESGRAKAGDVITLSLTAQEDLQLPQVSIAGHAALVTPVASSSTAFTATYTMTQADAEGIIAFTINFQDDQGNAGTAVTATTDNSSVVFDRTAPVLTTVSIASNNADAAKAKAGDVITLHFTANEPIASPQVSIAGQSASVTVGTAANAYQASYTMTDNDVEGPVSFSISIADITGNAGTAVTVPTDNSSVVFDRTVPVLAAVSIASNNADAAKAKAGDVVSVSFTANEPILAPVVTIAGQAAPVTADTHANTFVATYTMTDNNAEGPVSFSIGFSDVTGNAGTAVTVPTDNSSVVFDRTVPVLAAVSIASNNADAAKAKAGDVVSVSFTANEPILAPVVTIAGQNATVTAGNAANTYQASYTMTRQEAEGPVAFSIRFSDVTGNAGTAVTATTDNTSVLFDKTVPTAVISSTVPDPTNSNQVLLTINFSEKVAGVEDAGFSTVNGALSNVQTTDNISYTAVFTPATDGVISVVLDPDKARDAAANGNSRSNTWTSTYDATRPRVSLATTAADPTNAPFTVSFSLSEKVNGFEVADIVVENGSVSEFSALSESEYSAKISPVTQGQVAVSVGAGASQDAAGNTSEASSTLRLTYDSMAPADYVVAFHQTMIDFVSQTNASVKVSGAEIGAAYNYSITSAGGGTPVTGAGTVAAAIFDLANLDLKNLADGQLTVSLTLTDAATNVGANATATVMKYTRNIVAFRAPATLHVPIRMAFANAGLPATVEVTYSDNSKQQLAVTWQPGAYNGLVAGSYELTGTFTLAPGTTNLDQVQASMTVVVEPNKVPTALTLSQTSFSPNIAGTDADAPQAIGGFNTTDEDDSQHVYELVSGQGSTDNGLFEIVGNELLLKSNKGLSGQTSFAIRVRATDPYNNTIEQSFTLSKQAYAKPVAELKIVNTFSPNGDGVNDAWIIPELRFYNNVEVQILDRSGKLLFRSTDPEMGWDGKADNGLELKGAVLYIVRIHDINLVKKGVVTILRK